eukprot:GHVR01176785.1.p2 GENE.GHVR01176785.1~~GHVR01176785.1.p2  ORF type:complete len:106 (+),score=16.23 GHVR01176785.1:397-714(+)
MCVPSYCSLSSSMRVFTLLFTHTLFKNTLFTHALFPAKRAAGRPQITKGTALLRHEQPITGIGQRSYGTQAKAKVNQANAILVPTAEDKITKVVHSMPLLIRIAE